MIINNNYEIVSHEFSNCIIKVNHNYRYSTVEEEKNNEDFVSLMKLIRMLNRKYRYMDSIDTSQRISCIYDDYDELYVSQRINKT